jgi:hypothetical protein
VPASPSMKTLGLCLRVMGFKAPWRGSADAERRAR